MADYRALCAELLTVFDSYDDESNLAGIFDDMKANKNDLLDRARAALAEPVPPVNCPGCEGVPAPGNQPCAVCGKEASPPSPVEGEVAELVRRLRDFMTVPLLQERVRAADLLERLAEPDPVGPSDEEIEGVARLIYRAMQDATAQLTPDWTERGNSGMQDTARGAARAVFARWGNLAAEG